MKMKNKQGEMKIDKFKTVDFFCKYCNKSFHAFHVVTGNENEPVMKNFGMKCEHCKRVLTLKKHTERELMLNVTADGKYYV